jgi:hypothetical protein
VDKVASVSCDDPVEKCTISGDDVRRAFYIRTDSLVEPGMGITGIRFTSGRSPDGVVAGGGGLFMYRSRVEIDNCEFSNNIARYEGTNPFTGHETAGGRGKPPPPRARAKPARKKSYVTTRLLLGGQKRRGGATVQLATPLPSHAL